MHLFNKFILPFCIEIQKFMSVLVKYRLTNRDDPASYQILVNKKASKYYFYSNVKLIFNKIFLSWFILT
jgi:hypothetical protein